MFQAKKKNRLINSISQNKKILLFTKGAKYSQLPILNKIPTNGLNSFSPALYGTLFSYFLKNHNTLNLPLQLLFS